MCITKNTALSMQQIINWCSVGGEDAGYNNHIMFKEVWDHEDKNECTKWRKAIHKEIANMTKMPSAGKD